MYFCQLFADVVGIEITSTISAAHVFLPFAYCRPLHLPKL